MLLRTYISVLAVCCLHFSASGQTTAEVRDECHTAINNTVGGTSISAQYAINLSRCGGSKPKLDFTLDVTNDSYDVQNAQDGVEAVIGELLDPILNNSQSYPELGELAEQARTSARALLINDEGARGIVRLSPVDLYGNDLGSEDNFRLPTDPDNFRFGSRERDLILFAALADGCSPALSDRMRLEWNQNGQNSFQNDYLRTEIGNAAIADPGKCLSAIEYAGNLFIFQMQLNDWHSQRFKSEYQTLAAAAQTNFERWDAYHFGGGTHRVQLPWELWLNSAVYSRFHSSKTEQPWPEPPDTAWTLLHPIVGIAPFEIDGADSGIIGGIEVIGLSRWSYNDANERENEWGLSLAAIYQPNGQNDGWYPGLVLRTPYRGLNITYARVEDDNGGNADLFALSVDVGKLFSSDSGLSENLVCTFNLPACPD